MAPILSFTAEEIWQNMPGKREARCSSKPRYTLPEDPAVQDELTSEALLGQGAGSASGRGRELEQAARGRRSARRLKAEVDLYFDAESAYETLTKPRS